MQNKPNKKNPSLDEKKKQWAQELRLLLDRIIPESLKGRRNDFDAMSKILLKDPRNAKTFLRWTADRYFPLYRKSFHFDQLSVLETEFANGKGKQYRADILLGVPLDRTGFDYDFPLESDSDSLEQKKEAGSEDGDLPRCVNAIFHIEHLSNQKSARTELLAAAKSAEYIAVLRRNLLAWEPKSNNPLSNGNPLFFISSILRHGKRPFRGVELLKQRLALNSDEVFFENSVNGIPFVIDLSIISDDMIKDTANSPEYVAVMLVLKWVYSPDNVPHFLEAIQILKERSEEIVHFDLVEYLLAVICKYGKFTYPQLIILSQNIPIEGEIKMSIENNVARWVDNIYSDGIVEGKELGIVEGKELGIVEGKELGIVEGKELGIVEGKELGIVEGKELGIVEGKELGKIESIIHILDLRFPAIPERVKELIRQKTDCVALESLLSHAINCNSLEEFEMDL